MTERGTWERVAHPVRYVAADARPGAAVAARLDDQLRVSVEPTADVDAVVDAAPEAVVVGDLPKPDRAPLFEFVADADTDGFLLVDGLDAETLDRADDAGFAACFDRDDRHAERRLARAIERRLAPSDDSADPRGTPAEATLESVETMLPDTLSGVTFRRVVREEWETAHLGGSVTELLSGPAVADRDWLTAVVDDRDAERVATVVEDAIAAGEDYEVSYRLTEAASPDPSTADGVPTVREYGRTLDCGRVVEGFLTDITAERERAERLAAQRDRISALHDAAMRVTACETREEVCGMLVWAATDALGFDSCRVLRPEGDGFAVVAETGTDALPDPVLAAARETVPRAFEDRTPVVTPDLDAPEPGSALTLPVGQYGVFQAVADAPSRYRRQDHDLAGVLVDHAVMAIDAVERERTLRERSRELREKNRRLEEFAGVLSHDLRNPLAVARGWTELLDGDEKAIDRITTAHERMETIIDDVLALARDGEPVGDPDEVDLDAVARRAWDTVATADATLRANADLRVAADPDRLRRLFENLFSNAVTHGGDGVAVRVGATDGGFFVADDGPGIDESIRDSLFDSGVTTRDGGTGFGLAIVGAIVDAHGWSVSVGESVDGGARFEVRVDADAAPGEEHARTMTD